MSLYEHDVQSLEGQPAALAQHKGKVALVVNLASRCGFTPQYSGLEALHQQLAPRGFAVLGFPCNQFGAQEPGTPAEIREFCTSRFGVTFPLFEKVEVKGPGQHPVYQFLTARHPEPGWNFTKYLVGKDGQVIQRYDPNVKPDDPNLMQDITAALDR